MWVGSPEVGMGEEGPGRRTLLGCRGEQSVRNGSRNPHMAEPQRPLGLGRPAQPLFEAALAARAAPPNQGLPLECCAIFLKARFLKSGESGPAPCARPRQCPQAPGASLPSENRGRRWWTQAPPELHRTGLRHREARPSCRPPARPPAPRAASACFGFRFSSRLFLHCHS